MDELTQVAPGVQRLYMRDTSVMHVGGIAVYVVGGQNASSAGSGQALLIDTADGTPAFTAAILEHLRQTAVELIGVLITHHHNDHWGGAAEIQAATGAPVRAHPEAIERIRAAGGSLPMEPLHDGDLFAAGGLEVQAVATPGHCPDHVAYFCPQRGVLFTGDTILGVGSSTVSDLFDYMATLDRLARLPSRVICPAHGPVVPDPAAKIREYIEHRLMRERQVLEQLALGARTPREMVLAIYADVDPRLHDAAERNVRTHLAKLIKEGRAVEIPGAGEDGPARYRLT